MVDLALSRGNTTSASDDVVMRSKVLGRLRLSDGVFRNLTRGAAIFVLVILGGVIVALIDGSLPALREFGLSFLYEERWNPVTEKFGAFAAIYGTSSPLSSRWSSRFRSAS